MSFRKYITSDYLLQALIETQKAAVKFERANSAHTAAKEMVFLAEEGLKTEGRTFDHAWQEMLNHATMRVSHHIMRHLCPSESTFIFSVFHL